MQTQPTETSTIDAMNSGGVGAKAVAERPLLKMSMPMSMERISPSCGRRGGRSTRVGMSRYIPAVTDGYTRVGMSVAACVWVSCQLH